MAAVENNRYDLKGFEFPIVDYPEAIGRGYLNLKKRAAGYGDMKSFMCYDQGFRDAMEFIERKMMDEQHTIKFS